MIFGEVRNRQRGQNSANGLTDVSPVDSQNSSGSFQEGFPATFLGATSSTSTTWTAVFGSKLHHSSNGGERTRSLFLLFFRKTTLETSNPHKKIRESWTRRRWSQWSTGSPCRSRLGCSVVFRFHRCTFSITRIVGRSSQVEDCCA